MRRRCDPHSLVGLPLALAVWLTLAGAGPTWSAPGFDGEGRVIATDAAQGTVTLDHGAIDGLLPARRSTFAVEQAALIRAVAPGDRVRFSLAAADEAHGLLRLSAFLVEPPTGSRLPGLLAGLAAAMATAGLVAAAVVGVLLWRSLKRLHRRITALDHELGMLRRLGGETSDASRQIVRALDEIAQTVLLGLVRDLRGRLTGSTGRPTDVAGSPSAELPPILMVVQRGRPEVFRAAESRTADAGLRVIWDRRRTERRAGRRTVALDRRHTERRSAPPETWTRLGFTLAPPAGGEAGRGPETRAARPLRAVSGERGSAR